MQEKHDDLSIYYMGLGNESTTAARPFLVSRLSNKDPLMSLHFTYHDINRKKQVNGIRKKET